MILIIQILINKNSLRKEEIQFYNLIHYAGNAHFINKFLFEIILCNYLGKLKQDSILTS